MLPVPRTVLAALLALALGMVGCGGDGPPRRVLIVGWDGATFDRIDPLIEAGRLPHLAALASAGTTADLESTRIPISSAAWPTIATGRGPGHHGVYSFFRREEESYDVRLVSAMDVAEPPMWRILSGRGHVVNVWGVPVTYPPEPVRGTLVAGMLSPFDADYAHPTGVADRLRGEGFVPDLGLWRQDQIADMATVERQLAIKEREVVALLERKDWTFSMVVFKSLDVLCHRPNLRLEGDEISALYERLDAILGSMVAAAGPETTVIVLSDHGFAEYRRTFDLHRWLVESGWSAQVDARLPENGAGGPLAEARVQQRSVRLGTLDMAQTRAFADASEGPYGAIRLNVAGREPDGTLERAAMDQALDELERDLRTLEFPAGVPVVQAVYRGADVYPGPLSDAVVPDLVVEVDPAWRVTTTLVGDVLTVGGPPFPDHALDGVFIAGGAGVRSGVHSGPRGRMHLDDVAPLCLRALGEPLPMHWKEGPAPLVLERPGSVRRLQPDEDPGIRSSEDVYGDRARTGADRGVAERIKSIGYGG
ncbi:MAG: alkaline phosphatase family protein [Planctomycetota bacterium]